ncbi:MAG: DsrE family protein [Cyanobacteria bacterium NC_groundwater_1444_Ag_S-0.65um_54_12]|nr:DsrE family protein [Cyanobacteria bacterium NC_groundwater_1444_Ag_S-0.65um_54_12]
MKNLFILNDQPYGTERSYNGLRLAGSLAKTEGEEIKVFLIGDAASCAKAGQKVPNGYYNLEVMLRGAIRRNAEVGVCGSCMDARGLGDPDLVEGAHRSSLEELTSWTVWADRVLVF